MPGKSKLTADAAERAVLRDLSKSEHRGEADRARAILLTLEGRRAEEIGMVLGVHVSTVRNWRGYFAHGGMAGLRRRQRPGQQAKIGPHAGAIDLVFLDESEALTHPYLARCWARRGAELRIQAPGQAKKQAMLGAFDPVNRRLLVHTSATKRSTDFVALLDQLGAVYGTAERARPLVAVLDNGPIHHSKLTTRAIAQRTWLTVEWLPKYAPELNDPGSRPGQAIERCWRDLKQHQLANRTPAFTGAGSSPMRTLSNAPFLTPSPALTTSDNLIHRLFPYSLLRDN